MRKVYFERNSRRGSRNPRNSVDVEIGRKNNLQVALLKNLSNVQKMIMYLFYKWDFPFFSPYNSSSDLFSSESDDESENKNNCSGEDEHNDTSSTSQEIEASPSLLKRRRPSQPIKSSNSLTFSQPVVIDLTDSCD